MASAWATNVLQNCLGLRPGEAVLVMVDEPLGFAREALCAAARNLGAGRVGTFTLPAAAGPLAVVPQTLLRRVEAAHVVVSLLSTLDLGRESTVLRATRAAFRAVGQGRWAAGAQIDADVLEHELNADYREVARTASRLATGLTGGGQVRLITPAGTDLTFRLGGRPILQDTGLLTEPGSFGNLPAGEVFTAPLEESAEGRLVVDLSLGDLPLDRPTALTFRAGRVVSVEGGEAARALERRLGADPRAWTLGEFGIGANPRARIRGRVATDEKVLGTVHVALGGNAAFGGQNPAETHYDCVVAAPQVYVDDQSLPLVE